MERMVEQISDQSYHQYYNFLSESKWDYKEVNKQTALEASALMKSCKAKSGKPTVYIIDESSHLKKSTESVVEQKPKIKYSFSNGSLEEYTPDEYAYFQCNRYWVERCFDDTKNELGLSGYQVRKWLGWQHHQSLVMMASLFLLNVRIEQKPEYELMSLRYARIMIIAHMFSNQETIEKLYEQMIKRHKDRKRDINRFYENVDGC